MKELSLVLTCHVTAAFCASASDVCAQKNVYQKFKVIWFKTHDFSAIDIIQTKQMFFSRVSEIRVEKSQPYSGKGGGEQQLFCI